MGAPLSMAWEAWACRSQCTEAAGLTPARLAAALTMKLTARSVRAWPGLRTDSNTGAEAGASPRLANRRAAMTAGISTCRTLSPLVRADMARHPAQQEQVG